MVDVELLDVRFAELADDFVCLFVGEAEEAGVPHFWVVRDAEASIGVGVFCFIGGTKLRLVEEDPRPSGFGGSRKDAGELLQVGSDGFAECSDLFTGGHGTDSVGARLDGEAGPDGGDVWGGEIHLDVLL